MMRRVLKQETETVGVSSGSSWRYTYKQKKVQRLHLECGHVVDADLRANQKRAVWPCSACAEPISPTDNLARTLARVYQRGLLVNMHGLVHLIDQDRWDAVEPFLVKEIRENKLLVLAANVRRLARVNFPHRRQASNSEIETAKAEFFIEAQRVFEEFGKRTEIPPEELARLQKHGKVAKSQLPKGGTTGTTGAAASAEEPA